MPELTRALSVRDWNGLPVLAEIARQERGDGESLIRIEAAAITHLDLTVMSGRFNIRPDLPYVGGVEGAGIVLQSDSFAPGTRVALRGGGLGLDRSGSWAEYVVVPDAAIRAVPNQLSPELAATSFSPLTTAHVALHEIARLGDWTLFGEGGEVVAVTGAGGAVGSIAIQLALRVGARVIGIVSRPESAALVPSGAEVVIASDHDRLAALSAERPVTLLVDTVGGADFSQRLGFVCPGGRAAVLGYTAGADVALNLPNWLLGDVALLPVNMLRREDSACAVIEELTALLVDGDLVLAVESFAMRDADLAFDRLRSGQARGRIVVRHGSD